MPKIIVKRLKGGYQRPFHQELAQNGEKDSMNVFTALAIFRGSDRLDQYHRPSEYRLDHLDHLEEHHQDHSSSRIICRVENNSALLL